MDTAPSDACSSQVLSEKKSGVGLSPSPSSDNPRPVLVIHGGAGTMSKDGSTPEQRTAFKLALASALKAGHDVLRKGGEAMDAAVAAVTVMEDCPLFNAGKGAVFNTAGKNELEASIMVSRPPSAMAYADHLRPPPSTRRGLGLTLLTRVRNPSKLARALYLRPDLAPHAFLSGSTAEEIGKQLDGIELVDPAYFFTEHRWREHRRGLGLPEEPLPAFEHSEDRLTSSGDPATHVPLDAFPTGTVGAVALDAPGCIAAVTSTGGKTNKLPGRIGDTPLMGAGFWAEEWVPTQGESQGQPCEGKMRAVGVSGTGDGDYFIRQATGSTIARRMQLTGETVEEASDKAIRDLFEDGGIGGVVALDEKGNVAMPLNCPGTYRGVIKDDGVPRVAIFRDDKLEEVHGDLNT